MNGERFSVVWAEVAVRDLEETIAYIASDSPGNAERVLYKLKDKAESLRFLPNRGRFIPELRDLGLVAWRELIAKPYRIVYRISGSVVLVLGDSRRTAGPRRHLVRSVAAHLTFPGKCVQ